jgi:hypothetical protein
MTRGEGRGENYASPSPLLFAKNDENAEFIKNIVQLTKVI